jgi:hypothetical protein
VPTARGRRPAFPNGKFAIPWCDSGCCGRVRSRQMAPRLLRRLARTLLGVCAGLAASPRLDCYSPYLSRAASATVESQWDASRMSDEEVRQARESSRAVAAVLSAALVVLLAIAPAGCGDRATSDRGRVALIGLDGATLRVIAPLLREARLPNLGAIARDGIAGPLRSHKPLSSPRIWNSIATGMSPGTHGITNFAYKDDGKRHLFSSTDRKVPALWNIASEAGLSVTVVNFWNTYPPERVNGVMVSDHVLAREVRGRAKMAKAIAPESGGSVVYPEEWQMRLSEVMSEWLGWIASEHIGHARIRIDRERLWRGAVAGEAELHAGHADVGAILEPREDRRDVFVDERNKELVDVEVREPVD